MITKKKVVYVFLLLLLAGIVGHSIWGSSVAGDVRERIAALEAREDWVSLETLQGRRIEDEENALIPLLRTADWLEKQAPIETEPEPLRQPPASWSDEERKQVGDWLAGLEGLDEPLREALDREGLWFDLEAMFQHRSQEGIQARLVVARVAILYTARAALASPDEFEAPLRDLAFLLELESRIENAGLLFFLLRNETALRVTQTLRVLARRPGFPAELYRERLMPLLRPLATEESLRRTLAFERHHLIRIAQRLTNDTSLGTWMMRPFRLPALLEHLERLDTLERMIALDESAYREARAAYVRDLGKPLDEVDQEGLPIRILDMHRHLRAELALTDVALAVLSHRAREGSYPADLATLATAGVELPLDPYGPSPFLLERNGEDTLLRSVGPEEGTELPTGEGLETLRWTFPPER